jgi:hypothetical protein
MAVLIAIGLVGMAWAHEADPPGTVYFAFQFEDGATPVADGYGDDWSFVPEFYWITAEKWNLPQRFQGGGGPLDPTEEDLLSFNPSCVYGWNDSANRMYLYVETVDGFHEIDREEPRYLWQDDDLEVRWMPAHVPKEEFTGDGGVGAEGTAQILQMAAVPPIAEGTWFVGFPEFDYCLPGGPVLDLGWSYDGTMLGEGVSTYRYELSTELYWTIQETYEETVMLDLEEGYTMHAATYLNDRDGVVAEFFWSTNTELTNNAEQDLTLAEIDDSVDQTAVSEASWGLIKAGFSK